MSGYRWDCFATLTFKSATGSEGGERAFRWWLYQWQLRTAIDRGLCRVRRTEAVRDAYGRSLRKRVRGRWVAVMKEWYAGPWYSAYRAGRADPVWVLGVERGDKYGRLHLHAVIHWSASLPNLRRTEGWRLWKRECDNGMARIEPPKSQEAVVSYCSKYVSKGELVLSASFDAARMPARQSSGCSVRTQRVESAAVIAG